MHDAVVVALSKSIPEICSSSLTTISGLMAMIFMQMHLHFLFNDGIIHKNAAACNRKSCKTPEKAVFFCKKSVDLAEKPCYTGHYL